MHVIVQIDETWIDGTLSGNDGDSIVSRGDIGS